MCEKNRFSTYSYLIAINLSLCYITVATYITYFVNAKYVHIHNIVSIARWANLLNIMTCM